MTIELVGQTIGNYKLTEVIGSGGMATVYKASQVNLDRWVALKILHYRDKTALSRFEREAKSIAMLRHRNILIVYDYGQDKDLPYLVMEYVQGGTLRDRLTGKPLDWLKAVMMILPIAEALNYAHTQGIVHRDVKPSNILMAQEDWPLLADFGLVKLSEDWQMEELTGTGVTLGTPAYVAPEQARAEAIDHRSDMYSLGVVLFEMVTGRLPFDYSNPNKVLLAHISETVPPPRQFNPDCPVGLERIILTTLEKLPANRYPDMSTVIRELRRMLTSTARWSIGEEAELRSTVGFQTVAVARERRMPEPTVPRSIPLPTTQNSRLFLPQYQKTLVLADKSFDNWANS